MSIPRCQWVSSPSLPPLPPAVLLRRRQRWRRTRAASAAAIGTPRATPPYLQQHVADYYVCVMLYNSIRRQKSREFDHWKRLLVSQHVNRVIRLKVVTNGFQKREILIIQRRIYSKNKIFKCIAPMRKSVSFLLKNSREWTNSSLTVFFNYSIHDIPQSPVLLVIHQFFNTGKSSKRHLQLCFLLFYRFLGRQLVSFLVPSCQDTAGKSEVTSLSN